MATAVIQNDEHSSEWMPIWQRCVLSELSVVGTLFEVVGRCRVEQPPSFFFFPLQMWIHKCRNGTNTLPHVGIEGQLSVSSVWWLHDRIVNQPIESFLSDTWNWLINQQQRVQLFIHQSGNRLIASLIGSAVINCCFYSTIRSLYSGLNQSH